MSDKAQLNDELPPAPEAEANSYQPSLLVKIIFALVNVIWVLGIAVTCIQVIFLLPLLVILPRLKPLWNNLAQASPLSAYHQIGLESTVAVLLLYLVMIVVSMIFLWIVWHLRKLIHTIKEGNPFLPENPERIRKIGYAILLWAPVDRLTYFLGFKSFAIQPQLLGSGISARPFLEMVFFGLVILVIAEVFQRGAKLQQEQDLTV